MKLLCSRETTNYSNSGHLIKNKFYELLDTRIWDNDYVQYLIEDEFGIKNWFSASRFSNRKEKLEQINKLNEGNL